MIYAKLIYFHGEAEKVFWVRFATLEDMEECERSNFSSLSKFISVENSDDISCYEISSSPPKVDDGNFFIFS